MDSEEIFEILRSSGAVKTGHFKLSSGLHADKYFQCALAMESPMTATRIGEAIASGYRDSGVETVVSPAIGGIVLGFAVAQALGSRFIWAEREKVEMTFRRGFCVRSGERVLIVEDVVTTGGSVAEVINMVKKAGGEITGVVCLINRGGLTEIEGVGLKALYTVVAETHKPEDCPQCAAGKIIESPGSRRV